MIPLQELLADADRKGYAVPAFNYSDIWELQAIVEAAQEARSPVICQSHMRVIDAFSPQWLGELGQAAAELATVPVINHLDHSNSVNLCLHAIDCRYPSIMYDGSALSLEENIASTKNVVAYARERGVCVEGEIGRIRGISSEGAFMGGEFLVRVEDAIRMTEETGVDSLAVGLGNAHGFYTETPQLNFQRLQEVNWAVSTPLVLHGGTGIPDADIQTAIRLGINKVNVGTHLHHTYIETLRHTLATEDVQESILKTMTPVKNAVKNVVSRWIHLCMANGRF